MKYILLIIILVISNNIQARSMTTVANQIACLSDQWLDDMLAFVAADDKASAQFYFDNKRCLILSEGKKVTMLEDGILRREFIFEGLRFYTFREGLK